jgi:hypothetical protein
VVPFFNPVRSRVVPAGTATEDKTMVEQEVFDLIAEAAPLAPEKVQVEARSSRVDVAITSSSGTVSGIAWTAAALSRPTRASFKLEIMLEGSVFDREPDGFDELSDKGEIGVLLYSCIYFEKNESN